VGGVFARLKQLLVVVFCFSAVSLKTKNPHTLLFLIAVVIVLVTLYVYVVPLICSVWSYTKLPVSLYANVMFASPRVSVIVIDQLTVSLLPVIVEALLARLLDVGGSVSILMLVTFARIWFVVKSVVFIVML